MSSGIDRSHIMADELHRSVATEVILRSLFEALEKRHTGITDEVIAAVNEQMTILDLSNPADIDFIETMKAAAQAVFQKPLI